MKKKERERAGDEDTRTYPSPPIDRGLIRTTNRRDPHRRQRRGSPDRLQVLDALLHARLLDGVRLVRRPASDYHVPDDHVAVDEPTGARERGARRYLLGGYAAG